MEKPTAEEQATLRSDFYATQATRLAAYEAQADHSMKRDRPHTGPPLATSWDDLRVCS